MCFQRMMVERHRSLSGRKKKRWRMVEPVSQRGKMIRHGKILTRHRKKFDHRTMSANHRTMSANHRKKFGQRTMLAHHRNWRGVVLCRSWSQAMEHCVCWRKQELAGGSWPEERRHCRWSKKKTESCRSWEKAIVENHKSQKILLVPHMSWKEKGHRKSQKKWMVPHMILLVPYMSSKEMQAHHMK